VRGDAGRGHAGGGLHRLLGGSEPAHEAAGSAAPHGCSKTTEQSPLKRQDQACQRAGATYTRREALELNRDRSITTAVLGSLFLMCVMAFGISMDVGTWPYAGLRTVTTHDEAATTPFNLAGSRYFIEHAPAEWRWRTLTGACARGS